MGDIVGFSRGAIHAPSAGRLGKGHLGYLRHAVRATAHLTGRPLDEVTMIVVRRAGVGDLRDISAAQMADLVDFFHRLQRERLHQQT